MVAVKPTSHDFFARYYEEKTPLRVTTVYLDGPVLPWVLENAVVNKLDYGERTGYGYGSEMQPRVWFSYPVDGAESHIVGILVEDIVSVEEMPSIKDKRASRRRDSLYEGLDDGERHRLEHVNSTRTSNLRWKFGEDPHDPEAELDSGYEYVKLEVAEDQTKTEKDRGLDKIRGVESGVECWECRRNDYLLVDERTAAESIASHPEADWAIKMNREPDFWRSQGQVLLFCPGCRAVTQLLKPIYESLKNQTTRKRGRA